MGLGRYHLYMGPSGGLQVVRLLPLSGTGSLCFAHMGYCILGGRSRGWCPRWTASTRDLYDKEMGAMKDEGQARLERLRNPRYKAVGFCMRSPGGRAHSERGQRGIQGRGHPEEAL